MKLFIGILFTTCLVFNTVVQAEKIGQWQKVDFYSDPLINLHHLLFQFAKDETSYQSFANQLDQATLDKFNNAIAFYNLNYISTKKSLIFDKSLREIKTELTRHQPAKPLSIPNDLNQHLTTLLPIYKTTLWPAHHKKNQAWYYALKIKLDKHGGPITQKLEKSFNSQLIKDKQRIDIVYEPGSRNGAYTLSSPPHTVITSKLEEYKGWAAFEMIFHEISHSIAMDPFEQKLTTILKKEKLEKHADVWHPIQFYIVGNLVSEHLASEGIEYKAYAIEHKLFDGRWHKYLAPMENYIPQYLAGKTDFNQLIDQLSQALIANHKDQ